MPMDTVILRNTSFNRLTVEARMGNSPIPENNASLGQRVLALGEDWAIPCPGETVFIRRDANPDNPDGRMTNWNGQACMGMGKAYVVNLDLMG